jgi:hypothetical protein
MAQRPPLIQEEFLLVADLALLEGDGEVRAARYAFESIADHRAIFLRKTLAVTDRCECPTAWELTLFHHSITMVRELAKIGETPSLTSNSR